MDLFQTENIQKIWYLLSTPFIELSGAKISITKLLFTFLLLIIFLRLSKLCSRFVTRLLESRSVDSGVRDSLGRFVSIGVTILGIFVCFEVLGVSLSSLAALGAILMVGIGFGLQNITQNFISGIIILIERPIKVGDIIDLEDLSGRVIDIRVRSSIVQTRDDVSIIVPNSKIIADNVINQSVPNPRIRLHIEVGVAYGSNLGKVQETLMLAAKEHPEVLTSPPPRSIFKSFGDSSLDFDLRVWTKELWEADRVSSEIRLAIDAHFRNAGITIPFPQRDVYIKEHKN